MEYAETNSVLVEFEFFCRKTYCRGGSRLNRPYKCMICRDGLVGAAGQTAPTKDYDPPLKNVSVVVVMVF